MSQRQPGLLERTIDHAHPGHRVRVLSARESQGMGLEQPPLLVGPEVHPALQAEVVPSAKKPPGDSHIGPLQPRSKGRQFAPAVGQRLIHVRIPAAHDGASETVYNAVFLFAP
jgi:hypothetical protein